jgi:uncharacterized cupredoxin-like copper-binding protein
MLLLFVPVVFLLASACAPSAAPVGAQAATVQVTVTGSDDFRFSPDTVTVKAGQPLQVTFQNGGAMLHDFTVQQGLTTPVAIQAEAGKSVTATMTFAKPGTYKFFCSQPGHDQLGMHGAINVQ